MALKSGSLAHFKSTTATINKVVYFVKALLIMKQKSGVFFVSLVTSPQELRPLSKPENRCLNLGVEGNLDYLPSILLDF